MYIFGTTTCEISTKVLSSCHRLIKPMHHISHHATTPALARLDLRADVNLTWYLRSLQWDYGINVQGDATSEGILALLEWPGGVRLSSCHCLIKSMHHISHHATTPALARLDLRADVNLCIYVPSNEIMVLTCREMQQVKVYWRCWSDLGELPFGQILGADLDGDSLTSVHTLCPTHCLIVLSHPGRMGKSSVVE
jgi:hypothetical protein